MNAAVRRGRQSPVAWKNALNQTPDWYATLEAAALTENVLRGQHRGGGWPRNTDWSRPLTPQTAAELRNARNATIDNGATWKEMRFLARVAGATKDDALRARSRAAFLRALDWLLAAQYPNGGWPQFYPDPGKGYHRHITFNDDAMIGALRVLRSVGRGEAEYAFVDNARRQRSVKGVAKGTDCILKTQIRVNGRPTVWCAQHNEKTLLPAPARAFEPASFSGSESVEIVRFLMEIEKPTPEVRAGVEGAVAWLEAAKLTGIRVVRKEDPSLPGGWDRVLIPDPSAPPVWARFYDLTTRRPVFCGRDGVIKGSLAEIEHERRVGYAWYTDRPAALLRTDYPAWKRVR